MFVVHKESDGKPNMEFRMHESGIHFYDPRNDELIFAKIVSGNKEGFTKRQTKEAADNAAVDEDPGTSDQPEQLIFTNRHGHLIGDTELSGVQFDDDEPTSEMMLNLYNAGIPGVDTAGIP
jgi:hypothetical protein